ncbi:Crp/Fnr family transcriptional regulator [Parabacteroides sp. Marseille-P3160]|uniref:Crp/Fnr family transcriptional regulator n=1 Tax=Parabacteroides sp. Marseille-P3160 TaxID=1917887 RepID=UPI0009B944AD|nr:Crp/Fnr family transcriptional regulator [Parabacteroides sp. Marseille-P3160]
MNIKEIAKCVLFRGVEETQLQEVLLAVDAEEVPFHKGEVLAKQDELCNRLIILVKGSITAEMTSPAGKVVKVEDIEAPSPLAILYLFGENNRFPVQVTTREEGVALVISKSSVLKMLRMNEALLKNYLDLCAYFASALSRKLYLISFRTIRQKIASYLLSLVQGEETIVRTEYSQAALAQYFGVSRPSLARELRRMQDEGLIEVHKKEIRILAKNKLFHLVHFS